MTRRRSRARVLLAPLVCSLVAAVIVPVALARASDAPSNIDASIVTEPAGGISFGVAGDGQTTTFSDDFDGPAGSLADPAKWGYQSGGNWGHGAELQQTTPRASNAGLTGNGTLLITAKGETYTGWDQITRQYTSARLMSKQSVLYGRVEARIRMSGDQGAWPAFWMMGANYARVGWPACGEIDVMESVNQLTNLYGSFHGPVAGAVRGTAYNQGKMINPSGGLANGWHVYAADWTPTAVTFLLDGVPYVTINRAGMPANQAWAIDNPQNIVLNISVGGMAGVPAPPSSFHATMEVDWVKVSTLP